MPAVRRLFVLGTPSMSEEVSAAGFTLTADSADDEPDAVLVGFDTELTFLAALSRGVLDQARANPLSPRTRTASVRPTNRRCWWIAAPSARPSETATGRGPDAVLGKPDPRMLHGLLERHELRPEQLWPWWATGSTPTWHGAAQAGALGVLVLTGEATAEGGRAPLPAA